MIDERAVSEPVRLLIVEDSPIDAELELRELQRAAIPVDVRIADDAAGLRIVLAGFVPHLVLCDLSLRGMSGLQAIKIIREFHAGVPVIIVTGTVTEHQAVLAMQGGAVDYVLKSNLSRLAVAVLRALDDAAEKRKHEERQHRVQRLSRIRHVLSAVNAAVLRIRDRTELFREVCRIAFEAGGFANVFIYTVDAKSRDWQLQAFDGDAEIAEELSNLFPRALEAADRKNAPTALRRMEPSIVQDITKRPDLRDLPTYRYYSERGIRSTASFPLIVDGVVAAIMSFHTVEVDYFDGDEVALLDSLVTNLSFALDHINKQERIDRLSRMRDVISAVNTAIVRLRDAGELLREARRIALAGGIFNDVFAFTIDPETRRITIETPTDDWNADALQKSMQLAVDDCLHGQMAVQISVRTQRPAVVNNVDALADAPAKRILQEKDIHAVGSFPLIVGGNLTAVMVYNSRIPAYFDEEEIELLTSLSENLAFAFERLGEQRRLARLSRIRNIHSAVNEMIVRVQDRAALLNEACRIAYAGGGFINVFVAVLDAKTHRVTIPAVVGTWSSAPVEHQALLQRSIDDVQTLDTTVAKVIATGKLAVDNDLSKKSGMPAYASLVAQGVAAVGIFPLVVDGALYGLMAFDTHEAGFFDDEEIELLTSLTNNLSFALDGIRRQVRVTRLSRIRDVLSAVNGAILRLRERVELCHEVCRIAVEAGLFSNVYVVEFDPESRDLEITAFLGNSDRETAQRSLRERISEPGRLPSLFESAVRSLRPVVKNDLAIDGRRGRHGARSAACLPLIVNGRGIGALNIETEIPGYFDEEEIELFTSLANNLSFALDLLDKQRRVDYLSFYDALTQLPNRTLFYDRLGQDLSAARKAGKMLALVLIDISRFSMLNNALGEHVGDEVLRKVAGRLRESAEESRIARVAGDRFVLCFPMLDDLRAVTEIVTEDGIKIFDAPLRVQDRDMHIMTRAGVAVFPNDGDDAETLFQNVEAALTSAKASGTTFRFYAPELNARLAKQLDLEARLQRAIEERQFVLYYQPKTELRERRTVGFEALIRWKDPDRGLVPPGDFVPLLEQTGLIINVGRWAMSEAVRQYEEWKAAGLNPPHIAVNLSAVQLRQERLLDDVRSAIEKFSGECGLDLEVTESMLMENFDAAIAKLQAVRDLGVQLSLDDFGTGYSSLSYIHRLPLNALKIDRSFIVGMDEDADKTSIVSTIISLAQALRLKVIAEGVETEEQARLLLLLRCDQIQGYLIGKPVPPEIAATFIGRAP
jgi:diguanylate cyclase (GGDEF)-like protein